jgi:proton-translocating NADH-quinone oxidoreductase chain N
MDAILALQFLIVLPFAGSLLIYLAGRLVVRRQGETYPRNPAGWLAFITLAVTVGLFAFLLPVILAGKTVSWNIGLLALRMDGIGALLAAVVLGLGLIVTLFSLVYMRGEVGEEKFYALLVAMIGTIVGLGCATDLFNLWVWFEAMAITSYMLVAFYRQQPASLEAGVKYLVQSAAGSVLVLFGIALVFGQSGTLDLSQIRTAVSQGNTPFYLASGALFLVGFGVKAALVPLHTWLPDAHSQAPSGISAMLSGVVIEAGLVALLRVLGGLAGTANSWGFYLLGFGAFNMLLGNLMALRQDQVKRMLAYSSVSHMGYILVGIGVAAAFGSQMAAAGGFFHIITHSLMKGLAFLSAGAFLYVLWLSRGSHNPLVRSDLDGAAQKYPLVAFTFSVALLSLGGLPPLAGFMSKWQIFVAGFDTGNAWVIALVIFAALNSVLSLGYYAPLINRMYRHEAGEAVKNGARMPVLIAVPLVLLAAAVILLGVWPSLASGLTNPAAQVLAAIFSR